MPRRSLPPRAERLAQPDPRLGPPLSEEELAARLLEGAVLFDAGEFFESHEAWEAAWHRAPQAERAFFRGLIHAAAACLHHQRGNPHGFDRQVQRLRAALSGYPAQHRGVAVGRLVDAISALPPPGEGAVYPRLNLALEPKRSEEGEGEGGRDRPGLSRTGRG